MATIYRGSASSRRLFVFRSNGSLEISPRRSQKIWNHSPDGFSWGLEGSGPAQLALALLLDRGETEAAAVRMHQDFKRDVVAKFAQGKDFEIHAATIDNWIGAWQKQNNINLTEHTTNNT